MAAPPAPVTGGMSAEATAAAATATPASGANIHIKTKVLKRILEATGWKPEEELMVREFFKAAAAPDSCLSLSAFTRMFVALGVEESYTPHYFRAMYKRHQDELADIMVPGGQPPRLAPQQSALSIDRSRSRREPSLTYKQFLLGVCAMDPAVPHGGAWGRERCKYIFTVYDLDDNNALSFAEFSNMVRHIRRARGDSTVPEEVEKEAIQSAKRFCDTVCRCETECCRVVLFFASVSLSLSLSRSSDPPLTTALVLYIRVENQEGPAATTGLYRCSRSVAIPWHVEALPSARVDRQASGRAGVRAPRTECRGCHHLEQASFAVWHLTIESLDGHLTARQQLGHTIRWRWCGCEYGCRCHCHCNLDQLNVDINHSRASLLFEEVGCQEVGCQEEVDRLESERRNQGQCRQEG